MKRKAQSHHKRENSDQEKRGGVKPRNPTPNAKKRCCHRIDFVNSRMTINEKMIKNDKVKLNWMGGDAHNANLQIEDEVGA